jgi:SAM-dependent methyltransferase
MNMTLAVDAKKLWEESFDEQIARQAYNTAAVEALVRCVAYYLRGRHEQERWKALHFMEMGCGAGPNLIWLAQKGIRVSGIDLARNALDLARRNLEREGLTARLGQLVEGSVVETPFENSSFDGIIEACVFQHLDRSERTKAFQEVARLLKPGGVFVGYMLAEDHTVYRGKRELELKDDPGSLHLADGTSKFHLTNIGQSHFFKKTEFAQLLPGFSVVDPCLTTYYLPQEEARKRGYEEYLQAMWTVYAIK